MEEQTKHNASSETAETIVFDPSPEEIQQIEAILGVPFTPEKVAEWNYVYREGCYPNARAYRDKLLARGVPLQPANRLALRESYRLNGVPYEKDEQDEDDDQYLEGEEA